jgi:hypothetical protein
LRAYNSLLRPPIGMKQTYSSHQEFSNGVSHSACTHQGRVDSWLLMVGSQTGSLTPSLSICHNLWCECTNDSCEPILDIYTLITFHWYKEHLNARCFDPCNRILKFWESRWTPKSPFRECECHPPILPKVGLRHLPLWLAIKTHPKPSFIYSNWMEDCNFAMTWPTSYIFSRLCCLTFFYHVEVIPKPNPM